MENNIINIYFLDNNSKKIIENIKSISNEINTHLDKLEIIKQIEEFYIIIKEAFESFLQEIKECLFSIDNFSIYNEDVQIKIKKRINIKDNEKYKDLLSSLKKIKIFELIKKLENEVITLNGYELGIPKFINNSQTNSKILDNKEEDENNCFNFDINTSQTSFKFYGDFNLNEEPIFEKKESNNKNSKTTLKCINHQNVDAIMKCTHCNNLYCEICSNKIKKESSYVNHILINLEEVLIKKELEKEKSLNTFSQILEIYIYKFNYIFNLNNDEICLPSFPNEKNIYDTNSQQNFLSEINSIYLAYILNSEDNKEDNNENNENELNEYNNKISLKNCNVNNELIKSIGNIFKNQKIDIEKNINDYDDDFYSDEYALDYEIEFEDIKNSFFYFINVVKKHNFDFNKDISIEIINKFKQVLNINKSNIFLLFDNKIDNYIKSKQFDEIPIEELDIENPMFKNFYKLKMFIENLLIKECKISKDKLDYRGNFINPNSRGNLIRGTEFYDLQLDGLE